MCTVYTLANMHINKYKKINHPTKQNIIKIKQTLLNLKNVLQLHNNIIKTPIRIYSFFCEPKDCRTTKKVRNPKT